MLLIGSDTYAILLLVIVAVITFALRASAFLIFKNKPMPKMLDYLGKVLPFVIMPTLIVYCVKDTKWGEIESFIPPLFGILVTAIIHFWKKNTIVSLIIGTATYMILLRIL